MKKLIIDGKIAVLISPSWGTGWSTSNYGSEAMLFDYHIASMIHNNVDFEEIKKYAKETYPDADLYGLGEVKIQWLPEGTRFQVREYDGYEWIETYEEQKWLTT